jgi:DNA-3-methyladenine glycosylase
VRCAPRSPDAYLAGVSRLQRQHFATDAATLAQRLLGCTLESRVGGERTGGVIVETEAYLGPEDGAAHSKGWRRTPRTEPMFGKPGTCYVFLTYGMHHCVNVVCEREGYPAAVLIRALEPDLGRRTMRARRASASRRTPLTDRDLCSGPAKLCRALGITRELDGIDLARDARLRLLDRPEPPTRVVVSARIGVASAGDWAGAPLRWYVRDSPHVSVRDRAAEASAGLAGP